MFFVLCCAICNTWAKIGFSCWNERRRKLNSELSARIKNIGLEAVVYPLVFLSFRVLLGKSTSIFFRGYTTVFWNRTNPEPERFSCSRITLGNLDVSFPCPCRMSLVQFGSVSAKVLSNRVPLPITARQIRLPYRAQLTHSLHTVPILYTEAAGSVPINSQYKTT